MILADRNVRRLSYKLDSDITSMVADNIINYELTRIESNAPMSTLEIETEQWVHDCCFIITSQPVLRIRLKPENNYPKITAYLRFRTPLSSIVMAGTGSIQTNNLMQSDNLVFELSGTGKAKLNLEIFTQLEVIVSGTGVIELIGRVKGTTYVRLTGSGEFDGRMCPADRVIVDVTGVGTAYVVGEQAVDIGIGGVGNVYYHGPLRNQRVNGFGSIHQLTSSNGGEWNRSTINKSSNYFYFLVFIHIFVSFSRENKFH